MDENIENKSLTLKDIQNAGFIFHSADKRVTTYKAKKGYMLHIYPAKYNGETETVMELYKDSFFNVIFKSRVETIEDFEYLMKINKIWE